VDSAKSGGIGHATLDKRHGRYHAGAIDKSQAG
jgi:hypothetical protein